MNISKDEPVSGKLKNNDELVFTHEPRKLAKGLSYGDAIQKTETGHELERSVFLCDRLVEDPGRSELMSARSQLARNDITILGHVEELSCKKTGRRRTVVVCSRVKLAPSSSRIPFVGRVFWSKPGSPGEVDSNDARDCMALLACAYTDARRWDRAVLPLGRFGYVRTLDPSDPCAPARLKLVVFDRELPHGLPPYTQGPSGSELGGRGFAEFSKSVLLKESDQRTFCEPLKKAAWPGASTK